MQGRRTAKLGFQILWFCSDAGLCVLKGRGKISLLKRHQGDIPMKCGLHHQRSTLVLVKAVMVGLEAIEINEKIGTSELQQACVIAPGSLKVLDKQKLKLFLFQTHSSPVSPLFVVN